MLAVGVLARNGEVEGFFKAVGFPFLEFVIWEGEDGVYDVQVHLLRGLGEFGLEGCHALLDEFLSGLSDNLLLAGSLHVATGKGD